MIEGMIHSDETPVIQPGVLLKPASWLANIDFINHLILFNNMLITIVSEKEGGKSSFASLLQANLDQQIKPIALCVKPQSTKENIISEIAAQLQLTHNETMDMGSLVAQINERKTHILLLLDDAHCIPESFITEAMVAIKKQENFSFFHLCLIADDSISTKLNHLIASFCDNFLHTIELDSLNESETRTYVLQRAMLEKWINKPPTDEQFKQFYQLTKGNIAKINKNLEAFIMQSAAQIKKTPPYWAIKAAMAMGIIFLGGLLGFYVAQNHERSLINYFQKISTPTEKQVAIEQLPPKILISEIPSWLDSSTHQQVSASFPKRNTDDVLDEEITRDTVSIIDKVVVIPKLQFETLAEPKSSEADSHPKSDTAKITTVKTTVSKPGKKLSSSKPALYTIQIVAGHNKRGIEQFQQNKKLLKNFKLRKFTNAKGTWYVLTLGEFQSKAEAKRHISKLNVPGKLNSWIRPLSNFK